MPLQIEINSDFQKAFDLVENSRRHLFITGKAGSGKSTLLEYCCRESSKNLVVLAPTGVAALNVHGQTIHRFFGFPLNISVEKIKSYQFTPRAKRIYKKLQTLVIDEASMLRADILDCIDAFLRLYGPVPGTVFGGVQMIFVGDLYQLPPVVTPAESAVFCSRYASPYFFSADVFRQIPLQVIELTKIYRQTEQEFIELLSRIRRNCVTAGDLALLNSRCRPEEKTAGITLTTTNQLADSINRRELEKLNGRLYLSEAVVDGNFSPEMFPGPEILEFKVGAQIMFLNNDVKNRWVNGSLGSVEEVCFSGEKIRYIRVRLQENARLVDVFPINWEIFKYRLEGSEIIAEVAGAFTQYPFRLAWAVTIHKSQGKTFDRVEIDIGHGTFATGQLYVALSRCRTFAGIRLSKPLRAEHILTDPRISDFMRRYEEQKPLELSDKTVILQQAALARRKLEIRYRKPDGTVSRRIIIPQHITDGRLLAFCTQRGEQRSFTITRIESLQPVEG